MATATSQHLAREQTIELAGGSVMWAKKVKERKTRVDADGEYSTVIHCISKINSICRGIGRHILKMYLWTSVLNYLGRNEYLEGKKLYSLLISAINSSFKNLSINW